MNIRTRIRFEEVVSSQVQHRTAYDRLGQKLPGFPVSRPEKSIDEQGSLKWRRLGLITNSRWHKLLEAFFFANLGGAQFLEA